MDLKHILKTFRIEQDFFVGIDSDGCVFPTMDIKQKDCFHPLIIAHWGLQAIEKELRETAEFVNLYSIHRGTNRFPALALTFDMLRTRKDVLSKGVNVPELCSLKRLIAKAGTPSNSTLATAISHNHDPELKKILDWSLATNEAIEKKVKGIAPFKWVHECLNKLTSTCDAIVVSQTPVEALEREWKEHNIRHYVKLIAGQEMGSKADHISLTAKGHYPDKRIILVGDALGDLNTAHSLGINFYPIKPGHEEKSWEELLTTGLDRFLADKFTTDYQTNLITDFRKLLPDQPPWAI